MLYLPTASEAKPDTAPDPDRFILNITREGYVLMRGERLAEDIDGRPSLLARSFMALFVSNALGFGGALGSTSFHAFLNSFEEIIVISTIVKPPNTLVE